MFTFIAFNKMRFFVWSFVRLFAGFGALFFSPRHSMESKEQQKKSEEIGKDCGAQSHKWMLRLTIRMQCIKKRI